MQKGRNALLIADLGFGDAGKGTMTDYYVRATGAHTVVRYNGGAQAAHNVVTSDGKRHTFAQWGSGTFAGAATYLARDVLIAPFALCIEAQSLRAVGVPDPFALLSVAPDARVITPFHQAANRLKELARGLGRRGSCGMGVGETASDAVTYPDETLFAEELEDAGSIRRKLKRVHARKLHELDDALSVVDPTLQHLAKNELRVLFYPDEIIRACVDCYGFVARQNLVVDRDFPRRLFCRPGAVVFEGAQGVLLDQHYGFHPYTTWSDTTFANADRLLSEYGDGIATSRVGVLRAYAVRHGPGPFVTEDAQLTERIPDLHNRFNEWQRAVRIGWHDLVADRYALDVVGGVDMLTITNVDRLYSVAEWNICDAYRLPDGQLPELFTQREGTIPRIRVHPTVDLCRQERLTRALGAVAPVYRGLSGADETRVRLLVDVIEKGLGVRAGILSCGPTATDKIHRYPLDVRSAA